MIQELVLQAVLDIVVLQIIKPVYADNIVKIHLQYKIRHLLIIYLKAV